MKKITLLTTSILLLLVTMSCNKHNLFGINGSGSIVSENIELESITGIHLSIDANVIITKGDNQEVIIEAQQNIIDNIKTTVNNDIWNINYKKNVLSHKDVTIYITVPAITSIDLSGSADITGDSTFTVEHFDFDISGSGSINFLVIANSIDAEISGSGKINLTGSTDYQYIDISGSGEYNAFDVENEETEVNISGSGKCRISVSTTLDATISGSGIVYYKGYPSIHKNITGSGSVIDFN